MGKIANLLDLLKNRWQDIKEGPEAERWFDENEAYREKWSEISEYGDPSGKIVGYNTSQNNRPIYEGGLAHKANIKSELTSLSEQGGQLTDEELQSVGLNPNRRGNFDPYEGHENQPVYQYENRIPSIGNVGVWGAGGGTFGANNMHRKTEGLNQDFYEKIEQTNPRGDYIKSTPNYFEDRIQTPEGEMMFNQMGRGRGSSMYGEIPGRGSAHLRYSKFFGIPLGRRTY